MRNKSRNNKRLISSLLSIVMVLSIVFGNCSALIVEAAEVVSAVNYSTFSSWTGGNVTESFKEYTGTASTGFSGGSSESKVRAIYGMNFAIYKIPCDGTEQSFLENLKKFQESQIGIFGFNAGTKIYSSSDTTSSIHGQEIIDDDGLFIYNCFPGTTDKYSRALLNRAEFWETGQCYVLNNTDNDVNDYYYGKKTWFMQNSGMKDLVSGKEFTKENVYIKPTTLYTLAEHTVKKINSSGSEQYKLTNDDLTKWRNGIENSTHISATSNPNWCFMQPYMNAIRENPNLFIPDKDSDGDGIVDSRVDGQPCILEYQDAGKQGFVAVLVVTPVMYWTNAEVSSKGFDIYEFTKQKLNIVINNSNTIKSIWNSTYTEFNSFVDRITNAMANEETYEKVNGWYDQVSKYIPPASNELGADGHIGKIMRYALGMFTGKWSNINNTKSSIIFDSDGYAPNYMKQFKNLLSIWSPSVKYEGGKYSLDTNQKYYGRTIYYKAKWSDNANLNFDTDGIWEASKEAEDKTVVTPTYITPAAESGEAKYEKINYQIKFEEGNLNNVLTTLQTEKGVSDADKKYTLNYNIKYDYSLEDGSPIVAAEGVDSIMQATVVNYPDIFTADCSETGIIKIKSIPLDRNTLYNLIHKDVDPIYLSLYVPKVTDNKYTLKLTTNVNYTVDYIEPKEYLGKSIDIKKKNSEEDYNGIPMQSEAVKATPPKDIKGNEDKEFTDLSVITLTMNGVSNSSFDFAVKPLPQNGTIVGGKLDSTFELTIADKEAVPNEEGVIEPLLSDAITNGTYTDYKITIDTTYASGLDMYFNGYDGLSANGIPTPTELLLASNTKLNGASNTITQLTIKKEQLSALLKRGGTVGTYKFTLPESELTEEDKANDVISQSVKWVVSIEPIPAPSTTEPAPVITPYIGSPTARFNYIGWDAASAIATATWKKADVLNLNFQWYMSGNPEKVEVKKGEDTAKSADYKWYIYSDELTKTYLKDNPNGLFNISFTINQSNTEETPYLEYTIDSINSKGFGGATANLNGSTVTINGVKGSSLLSAVNEPLTNYVTIKTKVKINTAISKDYYKRLTSTLIVSTNGKVANGTPYELANYPSGSTIPAWVIEDKITGKDANAYCVWEVVDDQASLKEPWKWNSTDENAYAEIVANEVGYRGSLNSPNENSSDWNVMQGIPSTENISIAAGGTTYLIDLAGYYETYGSNERLDRSSDLYKHNKETLESACKCMALTGEECTSLKNPNALNTNAVICRTIKFNVTITNWWGEEGANNFCALTCPGHVIVEPTEFVNFTVTGCEEHGGKEFCSHCNSWVTSNCTCEGHGEDEEGNANPCPDNGHCTPNTIEHKCTAHLIYYCSNGSFDADNVTVETVKHYAPTDKKNSNHQQHEIEIKYTIGCKGGAGGHDVPDGPHTWSYSSPGLICKGYTGDAYGCVCTGGHNCIHQQETSKEFFIYETIDMYGFRSIVNMKLYALESSEVTNIDSSIIKDITTYGDNTIGQSSSNSNLEVYLWRANSYYPFGGEGLEEKSLSDYSIDESKYSELCNGRLFYTQFKEPEFHPNSDCGSTSINSPNADSYWLGDVEINITVIADSGICYEGENWVETIDRKEGAYQDGVCKVDSEISITADRGEANLHYAYRPKEEDPRKKAGIMPPDEYHAGTAAKGDWLSSDGINCLACHVVNAWLKANEGTYKVNVVSDQLVVGYELNDVVNSQVVRGDAYSIDDGLELFNCGFTPDNNVIYRNHSSNTKTLQALMGQLKGNNYSVANTDDGGSGMMESGYSGNPAWNPIDKYIVQGDTIPLENTLLYGLYQLHTGEGDTSNISEYENKSNVDWDNDNSQIGNGSCYTNSIPLKPSTMEPGITKITMEETGNKTEEEEFQGYYRNHKYPNKGNFVVSFKENGNALTLSGIEAQPTQVTNSGKNNMTNVTSYGDGGDGYIGTPLAISNIDLVDNAPNGIYEDAVTVTNHYIRFADIELDSGLQSDPKGALYDRATDFDCTYTASSDAINPIIIHNPITVQNCYPILNNYYSYEEYVVDERGEDLRIDYDKMEERNKDPYIVLGNTFHLWFSDIGDFRDSSGSTDVSDVSTRLGINYGELGSDTKTGEYNNKARGYVDEMNCSRWTGERWVEFSFPVSYYNAANEYTVVAANTPIDLSNVKATNIVGGSVSKEVVSGRVDVTDSGVYPIIGDNIELDTTEVNMYHYGSDKLQDYMSNDIDEFRFGLDYEFTCLTSASESRDGKITFRAKGFNGDTFDSLTESNNSRPETATDENGNTTIGYSANHWVEKTYDCHLVGRIGNLAIEDTQDFRMSNLFKEPVQPTKWLLDGVIKEINEDISKAIVSTPRNIMMEDVSVIRGFIPNDINADGVITYEEYKAQLKSYLETLGTVTDKDLIDVRTGNHAQFSITNNKIEDLINLGKADEYFDFPIAANLNQIVNGGNEEYLTEHIRFGYDTYLDIETIGEYRCENLIWEPYEAYLITHSEDGLTSEKKSIDLDSAIDYTNGKRNTVLLLDNTGNIINLVGETVDTNLQEVSIVSRKMPYKGPESTKDEVENSGVEDIRQFTMDVKPIYTLYDFDTKEFYAIDLYAGRKGDYTLYWSNEQSLMYPVSELYVDIEEEEKRRNITEAEKDITLDCVNGASIMSASVFTDKDYIGSATRIRLDQYNRSYIGSPIYEGLLYKDGDKIKVYDGVTGFDVMKATGEEFKIEEAEHTEGQVSPYDWATSSQRWHFTIGLPSSTYITYQGAGSNQLDIEESHEKLKAEHPNSVIVTFIDVTIKGSVWDLHYNHSMFLDYIEDIDDNGKDESIKAIKIGEQVILDYTNKMVKVYNKENGTYSDGIKISEYYAPVTVQNAWTSSSDDLGIFGTH